MVKYIWWIGEIEVMIHEANHVLGNMCYNPDGSYCEYARALNEAVTEHIALDMVDSFSGDVNNFGFSRYKNNVELLHKLKGILIENGENPNIIEMSYFTRNQTKDRILMDAIPDSTYNSIISLMDMIDGGYEGNIPLEARGKAYVTLEGIIESLK